VYRYCTSRIASRDFVSMLGSSSLPSSNPYEHYFGNTRATLNSYNDNSIKSNNFSSNHTSSLGRALANLQAHSAGNKENSTHSSNVTRPGLNTTGPVRSIPISVNISSNPASSHVSSRIAIKTDVSNSSSTSTSSITASARRVRAPSPVNRLTPSSTFSRMLISTSGNSGTSTKPFTTERPSTPTKPTATQSQPPSSTRTITNPVITSIQSVSATISPMKSNAVGHSSLNSNISGSSSTHNSLHSTTTRALPTNHSTTLNSPYLSYPSSQQPNTHSLYSPATRSLHSSSVLTANPTLSITSNPTKHSQLRSPRYDAELDNSDNEHNDAANDSDVEAELDRRKTGLSRPTSSYQRFNSTASPSATAQISPTKSKSLNRRALIGLSNMGNTCFLNSTLQCLFSADTLMSYFAVDKFRSEINPTQAKTKGKLGLAFAELAQRVLTAPNGSVERPSMVKACVSLIAPQFNNFGQQDSQEFLRCLLSGLHDDLNRIRKQPKYEEINDNEHDSEEIRSNRWWNNYKQRNDSVVVDLFAGQLKSTVKCNQCGYISTAFDPFMDLSLPIPQQNQHHKSPSSDSSYSSYYRSMFGSPSSSGSSSVTLMDCFSEFSKLEELSGNDAYYCRKCKKHQNSLKELAIFRYPEILVIHLKRFAAGNNNLSGMMGSMRFSAFGRSKLNTDVQFPLSLDLTQFHAKCTKSKLSSNSAAHIGIKENSLHYSLFAISNHMGSTSGGHYTANCLVNGSWYTFNDSSVSSTSANAITGPSAYVLFYQRQLPANL
jgi:ubiquitin C-terminal hydrolase